MINPFEGSSSINREPTLLDCAIAFEKLREKKKIPEDESLCDQAELNTSRLTTGDILYLDVSMSPQPSAIIFRVDQAVWYKLNAGNGVPLKDIFGHLEGPGISPELKNEAGYLIGSSHGGSALKMATIEPGASLSIVYSKDDGREDQEYLTGEVSDYAIFGKDENGGLVYKDVSIDLADDDLDQRHTLRLARVNKLLGKFGFASSDLMDFQQKSDSKIQKRETDNFVATYVTEQAQGNRLTIHDKKNSRVYFCDYFSLQGEDILQLGYTSAELDGVDASPILEDGKYATTESAINRLGLPIATFNSSSNLGLDAVGFAMSDRDAAVELGLEPIGKKADAFMPSPNIQLWPGDKIVVETEQYPFCILEEKKPGTNEAVINAIKGKWSPVGRHTITIGKKEIHLKNPDQILSEIESLITS